MGQARAAVRAALVVFDVPGTTIRDRGEIPAPFGEALATAGIERQPSEVAAWRGATKRDAMAQLVARHFLRLGEAGGDS